MPVVSNVVNVRKMTVILRSNGASHRRRRIPLLSQGILRRYAPQDDNRFNYMA